MFYYGEIGFQYEGQHENLEEVEKQAIEHSIAMGENPIAVFNHDEEVISIIIEGEIFDKRTEKKP